MPTHQLSYNDELGIGRAASDLWSCGIDHDQVDEERLARILDLLPPKQADLIELTRQNVPQSTMAAFFGCSQPAICMLLQRAIGAVRSLLALPEVSEESIVRDLTPHLAPELVELLRVYYRTGNYVRTGERLGYTQSAVRHRVIRSIRLLHDVSEASDYVLFFSTMLDSGAQWAHTRSGRLTKEQREEAEARLKTPIVSG